MKKLAVLAIIMLIATQAMAIEEKTQELIITTYGADFSIQGGITASEDPDTLVVTYYPTVTLRDLALAKNVKAWPATGGTLAATSLTDVVDGISTFKGAGTTDLQAAIESELIAVMTVVGVVQTGSKLAKFSMGGVSLLKKAGTSIASPGIPTAITWP